ncbi:MAG: hypothetical protein E6R08_06435 [Nevskiaceae bacterium]|nr:MAG: hypothetical protein E6R08_06435 [Nevskiaceae bacterium]
MATGSIAVISRSMGGFVFDATFEELHTSELEITEFPVEGGASITDHAYLKPYKLKITAGVSNTPLRDPESDDPFGPRGPNRIRLAFQKLQALQARREPFDVYTGLKLYKNMLPATITTPQDKDTANALVFSIDLREVNIVYTQIVIYPPRKKGKANNNASKKKEKGEQQGAEVDGPKKQSGLKRLAGALGIGGK